MKTQFDPRGHDFDRDHERVATPTRRADCPVASSPT